MTYQRVALYYNRLYLSPLNSTASFFFVVLTHPPFQTYTKLIEESSLAKHSLTCWDKSSCLLHKVSFTVGSKASVKIPKHHHLWLLVHMCGGSLVGRSCGTDPEDHPNLQFKMRAYQKIHLGLTCVSTLELSPRMNVISSEYKEWVTDRTQHRGFPHQAGGIYCTLWISFQVQNS